MGFLKRFNAFIREVYMGALDDFDMENENDKANVKNIENFGDDEGIGNHFSYDSGIGNMSMMDNSSAKSSNKDEKYTDLDMPDPYVVKLIKKEQNNDGLADWPVWTMMILDVIGFVLTVILCAGFFKSVISTVEKIPGMGGQTQQIDLENFDYTTDSTTDELMESILDGMDTDSSSLFSSINWFEVTCSILSFIMRMAKWVLIIYDMYKLYKQKKLNVKLVLYAILFKPGYFVVRAKQLGRDMKIYYGYVAAMCLILAFWLIDIYKYSNMLADTLSNLA